MNGQVELFFYYEDQINEKNTWKPCLISPNTKINHLN